MEVGDNRNEKFCADVQDAQLDIYGTSEINLAWHKLTYSAQPHSRFRSIFDKVKVIACNNRTDLHCTPNQRGGTFLGVFNNLSHRVMDSGFDKRNLGRWCWMSMKGAKDTKLMVVSIYRPCLTLGATTIYSQQRRALQQFGISTCPRIQFWNDLQVELQEWTMQGFHIVLGGDFNQPVTEYAIKDFFQQFGMHEAITSLHDSTPPGTHKSGSNPIDGIFCTASLTIKAGGYTTTQWGIETDHRLIWLDICITSAIGHNAPRFTLPKARKLQVDNPDITYRYIEQRLHLMKRSKLSERTQALYDRVLRGEKGIKTILELEKLDALRTSHMLEAEQRCRKIKAGKVVWSPEFQQSIHIIRYLRVLLRKFRGYDINSRTLCKYHSKLAAPIHLQTKQEVETMLAIELSNYRSIKSEAASKRHSFLENLAIAKAEQSGSQYDTMLKQLRLREYQRSLASQLKRLKGSFMQGLTEIEEDINGTTMVINDKNQMEQVCAKEGIRRFSQANHSPSLLPNQIELLGWTAQTEASDKLLKGEIPAGLHSELRHIASYFQTPSSVLSQPEINCIMTLKEFDRAWKRAREHTSSGVSGIHFGHFKADSTHSSTLLINYQLLQIAIILGYSMMRWQRAIDVMIPKKTNSKRVEKLRVICLMEADFNFMNKWMGRITMQRAESCNSIAAEQFGSRKNKSAILHAFNKALCFDHLRTTHTSTSLAVLDAKACYDRIPPPLACLGLRRQGLPQNIINSSFNTIKDMQHHIRTAFGVSKLTYERSTSYLHGILQGNGAGPCIWVMLSSPLLDKMKADGFGVHIHVPSQEPLQVVGFAFVDDVDLIQALPLSNPLQAVQQELNTWNLSLSAASGELEDNKCDVYILIYKWNSKTSQWYIDSTENMEGTVYIQNDNTQKAIRRQEPSNATLSLGVQFAPDGSMKDQVAHLRKKAEHWADLLRIKNMQKDAVWYSLTASIMKTIEYPLLATSISRVQFQHIMAPILLSALPRAGIWRYMNRDVIYSLPMHQGMGIMDPYVTQGIKKLFELMHENNSSNPAIPFLSAAMKSLEIFSGLGPNFLQTAPNKRILGIIENSLCRSLWEFLHVYGISVINLQNNFKQFNQDDFLMERIYLSNFTIPDIRAFNYCRIYLQVTRISECISMDGKGFRRHIWLGQRVNHRTRQEQWIEQPSPSASAWITFRKILIQVFQTNQEGHFHTKWDITSWNRTGWKWFFCSATSTLYEATSHITSLIRHPLTQHNRRSTRSIMVFPKTGFSHQGIPATATPVTIFFGNNNISVEHRTSLPPYYFELNIQRWSDHLNIHRFGEPNEFREAYIANDLILVSDGSYKDGIGAAAWIITSKTNPNVYIKGTCPTTGNPISQDSHRSELFGILGGIMTLHKYIISWKQPKGKIIIGCDNTSALSYAFDKICYPVTLSSYPDFDVIQAIRSLLLDCTEYCPLHVPGHQDDYIGPLDFAATLNVQMDTDAKYRRSTKQPLRGFAVLPNQSYHLAFAEHYICKKLQTTIREGISANTMQRYWDRQNQVKTSKFPLISWPEIGKAMRQSQIETRHWIVKHATGKCGVNSTQVHWKQKQSPSCLRCKEYEDAPHVWKCQHHTTADLWDKEIQDLQEWMKSINTSPYIVESLAAGLRNWYSGTNLRPWCPLIQVQHSLGWDNMILGRFHTSWKETQQDYYLVHHSKKSASAWLTKLILQLWKIAWKLWLVRNEYEHEHDLERQNQEIDHCIEIEIAIGSAGLPQGHLHMFSDREITFLRTKARFDYKRQWLENIKACRFALTSASIHAPTVYIAPTPI